MEAAPINKMHKSGEPSQIDQLRNCVSEMTQTNQDIGVALDRQNKMLDTVNTKVDNNANRLNKINHKLEQTFLK